MTDDQEELLERRLSENVQNRVETRLFRLYALLGAGLVAGLSYGGYHLLDDVRDRAETAVERAVKDAQTAIVALDERVDHQTLRIEYDSDRLDAIRNRVITELDELSADATTVARLAAAVDDLKEQRERMAAEFARLKTETENIATLAAEVEQLAAELAERDPGGAAVYAAVSETVAATKDRLEQAATEPVVYLQFRENRSDAQSLQSHLRETGFVMPGVERVKASLFSGGHFVRYYFEEDAAAANRLAAATSTLLTALGVADSRVEVQDFSTASRKAPQNVLELWVDL